MRGQYDNKTKKPTHCDDFCLKNKIKLTNFFLFEFVLLLLSLSITLNERWFFYAFVAFVLFDEFAKEIDFVFLAGK